MESVSKKISLLGWLFFIQGLIFAIATLSEIIGVGSNIPYWESLLQAISCIYIFLNIKKQDNNIAYNLAMIVSGLAIIGTGGPLFFAVMTKTPISLFSLLVNILVLLGFGVLPFSVLIQKQVKKYYIPEEKLIGPQIKSISGILFLIWLIFSPVLSIYLYAKFESFWKTMYLNPLFLIILIYIVGGIFLFSYFKRIGFWNKKLQ